MTTLPADVEFLLRFHGYDPADVEEFYVEPEVSGRQVVRVRVQPKSVLVNLSITRSPL